VPFTRQQIIEVVEYREDSEVKEWVKYGRVSSSKVDVAVVVGRPVVITFGGLVVDKCVSDVVKSFSVTVSVVVTSPVV